MELNRRAMKQQARALIRETRPSPALVALVFLLILWFIDWLSGQVSGSYVTIDTDLLAQTGVWEDAVTVVPPDPTVFGWLLILAFNVIAVILRAGFTVYGLLVSRRQPSGFGNLFDGFGLFFRVLWLYILEWILVTLWTCLLIVPGLIAFYKYRLALYLLVDHPDWSVTDCLRQSRLMMRGHKWALFALDLSFLGWYILCIFPPVMIFLAPFHKLTEAGFYNALCGAAAPAEPAQPGGGAGEGGQKPPWEY